MLLGNIHVHDAQRHLANMIHNALSQHGLSSIGHHIAGWGSAGSQRQQAQEGCGDGRPANGVRGAEVCAGRWLGGHQSFR